MKRSLRKKLEKYLRSDEESIQSIHFRLVKMGEKMILLEKAERGVEEPTRITVRIKESTFQREFSDYDNSALHTYIRSNTFRKEFQHDEQTREFIFTKTM